MTTGQELRNIPAFSELPDDQISWFLSHAEEAALHAGETGTGPVISLSPRLLLSWPRAIPGNKPLPMPRKRRMAGKE